MRIFRLLLLLTLALNAFADPPFPEGGVDLTKSSTLPTTWAGQDGRSEKVVVSGQAFAEALRVKVAAATPEKPWSASITVALEAGEVAVGDRLLITYMARRSDGGEGRVVAKAQLAAPAYTLIGMTEAARFGGDWVRVNQPFIAEIGAAKGAAEVSLFLGEREQTVEIAAIRVLNYGPNMDLAKLPRQKQSYPGREADAPWRKQALERISEIRMADQALRVVGADGQPLANAEVIVELDRHAFGFGSCVTRGLLTAETEDGRKYREIVARTFSRVVFENDLKPDTFPHDAVGISELEKSMDWLKAQGISIRGHYLMQEAVDGWTRERLGDPAKLENDLLESVRERIAFAGNKVMEWDVINHPVAWEGAEMLAAKGPPCDTFAEKVFREARQQTSLPMCINEDQIFRPGPQQDKTYELLGNLKRDGVRVDGLGNQAHFHSSYLPSPEYLLEVTDRFAKVVPKQVITEFDVVTLGDEELAADYLRDCLIACFSHPAYDGFLLWGFWENSHWLPDAALWRKDWSRRPAARMWEEWIGQRWHTRETLTTDGQGIVRWRGFKGSYTVTAGGVKSAPCVPGDTASPGTVTLR
ncbi:MAG: endo-1,4-beta-xylanase [Verrucomicrobiota bacterium]